MQEDSPPSDLFRVRVVRTECAVEVSRTEESRRK